MSHTSPGPAPPECRICREGAQAGPLTAVCLCTTPVHATCLQRWIAHRADALFPLLLAGSRSVCEVCHAPFIPSALSAFPPSPVAPDETSPPSKQSAPWPALCERGLVVLSGRVDGVCEYFLSVEGCLLIFLFVLAVMGHALFVVGMYAGARKDQYSIARVALGAVNAVLTVSLLVLVQKIVSRWLREADLYCNDVETGQGREGAGRGCGVFWQVLLGGVLLLLAAAEFFFLLRQLPFVANLE